MKQMRKWCGTIIGILMLLCVGCGIASEPVSGEAVMTEEAAVELPAKGDEEMNEEATTELLVKDDEESNEEVTAELPEKVDEELNEEMKEVPRTEDADDASSVSPSPAVLSKGIYVTGPIAGSERMEELVHLVTTTELNTMVIDIKNDEGNLTYQMELPGGYAYNASIRFVSDMPALINKLHDEEIYVIGRIVCFKDPILASARPELALRIPPDGRPVVDANGLAWVNPYKEEVWDYLCTIAECASKDGFDEIQFDYVRFPIGEDANAADYGVDMTTYPREKGLSDFFSYTTERLHEKGIVFGADLFGTVIGSDVDRDRTGQSYAAIAQMTDVICPMIYPSHYASGTFGFSVPDAHPYETIKEALALSQTELAEVDKGAIVRPWLQCFNAIWVDGHITYGSEAVKEQIRAVYDAGYEEWLLWNASNHYDQVAEALSMLETSTVKK